MPRTNRYNGICSYKYNTTYVNNLFPIGEHRYGGSYLNSLPNLLATILSNTSRGNNNNLTDHRTRRNVVHVNIDSYIMLLYDLQRHPTRTLLCTEIQII